MVRLSRRLLLALGATQLLRLSFFLLRALRFLCHRRCDWSSFRGEWALITAASAGIGAELATGLAARGLNLILVARRGNVLKEIGQQLENKYHIKTMAVVADLATPGAMNSVATQILPIQPAVVIANGGGLSDDGDFRRFTDWKQEDTIAAQSLTSGHVYDLLRLYLPSMIASKRGRILLVGSLSARFPQYIIPYAVEKARLEALAVGLHEELRVRSLFDCLLCAC